MSVYALGDLHGHYEIYEKVKAMLKPEDTVYFLGDAGDRGPDSWKCIKAIYDDPQFIYIKGNHEDMLVKAFVDVLFGRQSVKYVCRFLKLLGKRTVYAVYDDRFVIKVFQKRSYRTEMTVAGEENEVLPDIQ